MIRIRNLSIRYGSEYALQDVSLDIAQGECVLVTGPSGCGKSTLARALTGLIPHAIPATVDGVIQVAGMDVREHPISELAQQVGAVFQNPTSQLFHLRVEDEIAFGPHNLGLLPDHVQERVEWALDAVDITNLRDHKPADLSGGQKQRVAIAAALAMQPQVLVLDEPTSSLDVPGTSHVMTTLQKLRDGFGVTIVLIEHRLVEAARFAERAIVMDQGRIVADGGVKGVLGDRERMRRLGLRRPVEEPLANWNNLLVPDGHPPEDVQPLIELQRVTAGYNRHPVIRDIDLTLYPGEFTALVGDNGAGKSTLALVMAGLIKPSTGKVRFKNGKRPRPGLDISLLFQNPADQLFTDTVDQEVAFGPCNYRTYNRENHERILSEADLSILRNRRPMSLSMGQQQRTALASCLSLRPQLLILDEPTLGQDWGHLERLMDFLAILNRQGTAILLITHDYKLVHRYARRVVLLEAGRIAMDGRLVREQLEEQSPPKGG